MTTEAKQTMPLDSAERKNTPICTGVFDYFPAALAAVAKLSKFGNDKHNPGEPLHWARGKSMDHADCIARHLLDRGVIDPETGLSHSVEIAWRALALLQLEEEAKGAPMPRGASNYDPSKQPGPSGMQSAKKVVEQAVNQVKRAKKQAKREPYPGSTNPCGNLSCQICYRDA